MPPEFENYYCSFCGRMRPAPAGSVDRTREWRCLPCVTATPAYLRDEADLVHRLRGITA
jgi:hypothetical protein